MATLVLAFDARLDTPLPSAARLQGSSSPIDAPNHTGPDLAAYQTISGVLQNAPLAALEAAAAEAAQRKALALVLFGDTIDPRRASPSQAAALRQIIVSLNAQGSKTVCVLDEGREAADLLRSLGSPDGLLVATPAAPASFTVGNVSIDLASDGHDGMAVFESIAGLAATRWQIQGNRVDEVPGIDRQTGLQTGMIRSLPALQPRDHDAPDGMCGLLRFGPDTSNETRWSQAIDAGWLLPTQQVAWRTTVIDTPTDADADSIVAAVVSSIEAMPTLRAPLGQPHVAPPTIVRVRCRCGSVSARMRLGDRSADLTARVRSLFCARSFPYWCEVVEPDPEEPLERLAIQLAGRHSPADGMREQAGATSRGVEMFAAELVAVASGSPRMTHDQESSSREPRRHPAAVRRREAAWLALELLEVA